MHRLATILICIYFFFSFSCYSQQYPFVSYTTKDGLTSNRVSGMFQDKAGRLFFLTYNGLSIYDGARFTNYTVEDGLGNELVNDVMQMSDDSFWVATNTAEINCLVKGKIKKLITADGYCPLVNQLYRNAEGKLFAAGDGGLFVFEKNRFVHLSFLDASGKNAGLYLSHIQAISSRLMLVQTFPAESNIVQTLFLYDYVQQKIIAGIPALNFATAPGGNFWVMANDGIHQLNTADLIKNKLSFKLLPSVYQKISSYVTNFIFFDKDENCWFSGKENQLLRCDKFGNLTVFPSQHLLYERQSNVIFQDKEGTLWFCFTQNGVGKFSVTNLSILNNIYGLHYVSDINYSTGILLFFDGTEKKIVLLKNNIATNYFIEGTEKFSRVYITAKGMFGIASSEICKLNFKGNTLVSDKIQMDKKFVQGYGKALEDNYGNLIVAGNKYLTAIIDGKKIMNISIDYFADEIAKDKAGNIWVANRLNELMKFSVHPETPLQYLRLENKYTQLLSQINVRSACFDSSDNLWIGSRYKGLFRFSFSGKKITSLHITKQQGLSDNFISYLTCDAENNIWSCSPSGLDKISFKQNKIAVTNITQQSNIYEQVTTLSFDKDSTAWVLSQAGNIIKITHQKQNALSYKPQLYLVYVKSGKDTLSNNASFKFSYLNNNPSFYFAATSFLNERQIQYSYRLQGNYNNGWSTTSSNAFINFINLTPGDYILEAKVFYPASVYPEQIIKIPFKITPPWWQTKWFKLILTAIALVVFIISIRLYVRRKLEKQRIALEKKQAVEKERTRIATDMHDDLGAGLSRIKFLSETINLKKQLQQPVEEEISKIRDYAHDMIDKMGEIVWALNEKNDSLSDLISYTRAYAMEYLTQSEIACNITVPENIPAIFVTGEMRRNIFLTVKEALHNIVKHAKANEVNISITAGNNIAVIISDNGRGFDQNNLRAFSNGIHNMQKRIKEIGGIIEIKNNNGTSVCFEVPLQV